MLAQLRTRTTQIREFIDKGEFAAVYVPAFQAKDLALALDEHRRDLTDEKQKIVEPAVQKVVRSAYLLDAFATSATSSRFSRRTRSSRPP